mmetsp:Transcript_839/g.2371  ORF Transcript_839/g.2371 Transcript_839/m.2371 type:complete len:427 (-) Transcript_839:131-1411(-)
MPFVLADFVSECFWARAIVNEIPVCFRPFVVYVTWLLSAGNGQEVRDEVAENPYASSPIPRMLRLYYVVILVTTIVLLFQHLEEGVVDVTAFGIGATQMLFAAAALAVLNAPTSKRRVKAERKRRMLLFCVHASNAVLVVDVIFSSICIMAGRREEVLSVDLSVKLGFYLFATSLGFFALDQELARTKSELTFVWKIWSIEAIDFITILYGAVKYSADEYGKENDDDGKHILRSIWERRYQHFMNWDGALDVYVLSFTLNAVLFGGLASLILARTIRVTTFYELEEHPRTIAGEHGYAFVATFVFVLDVITDLPVWFVSLITRAYVHNTPLTLNIILNLLALIRGVYITIIACLADPPHHDGDFGSRSLSPFRRTTSRRMRRRSSEDGDDDEPEAIALTSSSSSYQAIAVRDDNGLGPDHPPEDGQ